MEHIMPEETGRNQAGFDAFTLKMIAIVAMTINHVPHLFMAYMPYWVRLVMISIGGLSFPIFAFLVVESYRHTRSVKKYLVRIFAFALISTPFFVLSFMPTTNVFFVIFAGVLLIYLDEHLKNRPLFWFLFALLTVVTAFGDWGVAGVIMIFGVHKMPSATARAVFPGVCAFLSMFLYLPMVLFIPLILEGMPGSIFSAAGLALVLEALPDFIYSLINLATIPLLMRYNGKRGRPAKYFFYIYYPLHLGVMLVIRFVLYGYWKSW